MKRTSILIVAGLALALPAFGADVDLSKLPPASTKKGLTYAKDIKPILETACFKCHGEEKQKGGIRLDSLEAVLKGGEDGKIVVAGKGKESSLVIAVSGLDPEKAMPPKRKGGPGGRGPGGPGGPRPAGPPPGAGPGGGGPGGPGGGPGGPGGFGPPKDLTPEQVGLIRAWIDQGAK